MEILRIIFPLLIVCVVVIYIIQTAKKRQGTDKDEGINKGDKEDTYMSEGMSIGMCLGVAVSTALDGEIAIGISVGMMLGMSVGMSIKKK